MDITLARTFLSIIASGSFVAAAERMAVTQSAISLRVQKIEELLGHRVFERTKSGVELTAHGHEFEPYCRSMIQIWEEARYSIAVPEGYEASLSVGSQYSLWPELSSVWLSRMEAQMPKVAFHVHVGTGEFLNRMLMSAMIDIGIFYQPQMRPGFRIEHILDDTLVLVTGNMEGDTVIGEDLGPDYVFLNWGQEFSIAHTRWFPDFKLSRVTMNLGALAVHYLIQNRKTAYLPHRVADDYVAAGQLRLIRQAPTFPYPAFAVWSASRESSLLSSALSVLRSAARDAPWIEI